MNPFHVKFCLQIGALLNGVLGINLLMVGTYYSSMAVLNILDWLTIPSSWFQLHPKSTNRNAQWKQLQPILIVKQDFQNILIIGVIIAVILCNNRCNATNKTNKQSRHQTNHGFGHDLKQPSQDAHYKGALSLNESQHTCDSHTPRTTDDQVWSNVNLFIDLGRCWVLATWSQQWRLLPQHYKE